MDKCHEQPLPAECDALVGFVHQQVLVRGGEFAAERKGGLGGLERVAGEGMRSARERSLEQWPQRRRGRPIEFGQFEAPGIAHRHPVGRRQRIADAPGGIGGFAAHDIVQPRTHLRRADLRRIGRMGLHLGQGERERHGKVTRRGTKVVAAIVRAKPGRVLR